MRGKLIEIDEARKREKSSKPKVIVIILNYIQNW